jgi:hypothetical protein
MLASSCCHPYGTDELAAMETAMYGCKTMKAVAIDKAEDHLAIAREALEQLHLVNGYKSYERAWSEIIAQLSRFYSKLEQGAKGCATSEPWFGQIKKARGSDPLMSYIHHARNSDEHGLDHITQRRADSMTLGFPATTEVKVGFEMMIDDKGAMHVWNPTVDSPNGGINSVEIVNPRVELVSVKDRGVVYAPPQMHDAKPIVDRSPAGCARLAIGHLERLLSKARKLPVH